MLRGLVKNLVNSIVHNAEITIDGLLNLFEKSSKILDEICATHVHADESFDDDSLFIIVENILKHATQTVDKIAQGTEVHVEDIEEKTPEANFSVPLCTLKAISREMCCKPLGMDDAHKTTLAILHEVSSYSWEAKASLTLAAFALEFGEFWLLAQLRDSDRLAKSIGILKRVPVLLKKSSLQKRRQSIIELNNMIKATLQVIDCIVQFKRLISFNDPKDVPALSTVLDCIPVVVYFTIIAIVACATKVTILTSDEDKDFDLAPYSQSIDFFLNKLNNQLTICIKQVEEADAYRRIRKFMQTPTEIMEVFKMLIFPKDNVQPLIDGSTKLTVSIDILKKQNVLLFISTLDVTEYDISVLQPVHELFTKKENQFKIVWVPIVKQWTDELRNKFEILKNKMPWFMVQCSLPTASIKFIKVDWSFEGKPKLVVMSTQGKVKNPNALYMIKLWGVKGFPFRNEDEEKLTQNQQWFRPVVAAINSIHPSLSTWVEEDKYIFFYGGKNKTWIEQFKQKATALANHVTLKQANISIEFVYVGKGGKGEDDHDGLGSRFWSAIECLFFTKVQKQADVVIQEIHKLFSYKSGNGWAVLTKGPSVLVLGPGESVLKVVQDFEKWKDQVKVDGFEIGFKAYFDKIYLDARPCCRLDIPGSTEKVPETMKCPDCEGPMEIYISYNCSHIDGSTAHH